MMRAFLALSPPPEIRNRLNVLQFMLPLPRRVDPPDLHLTLVFLGEVPDHVLIAVDEAMARLRAAPFALTLAGADIIGGANPRAAYAAVAPSEALARLQARLERIAREAGAEVEARRFLPHVTLGRFPPPAPEDRARLEHAVIDCAGFRAGPWEVDEVTLFRSHLRARGGASYEALAVYPLS
jgi:2'-5' RNA ligase